MKSTILTLSALSLALLVAGCNGGKKTTTKESQNSENTAVLVKTSPVERRDVAQTVDFSSSLIPYKKTFVTPQMALRIDRILVDVGDHVSSGQLVATLDKNQLNQSSVQLRNAEQNLARLRSVYEAGGASKQQIDELETSVAVLRETVDNLQKNIELRSPISGVITGRYNEPGDLFTMSGNADGGVGILQVMQINPVKAVVAISEQYYPYVTKGMPVSVRAEVYPDKKFAGKVSIVYPSINSSTRTFNVEVVIPNSAEVLRPGMFTRAEFDMGNRSSLTVSDLAVQKQAGVNDRYVYVIKDGMAERRVVIPGRQVDDRIEILSGVSEGEEVAVTGLSKLKDGAEVTVKND